MGDEPLPNKRECTTHRAKVGPVKLYVTVGFYDDGRVGELFLALEKTGSERRWLMDETARLASKLLQHGMPVEELGEMWLGTKSELGGPVQGDDRIKNCTSLLDYVARHLLVHYCDREDLAHVKKNVMGGTE